ncbi:hypothetical protein [Streptomyces sp. NPDC052496]|uniref:hypothetical protein n=1 Tax=Streptomyces sp. NPDC052496 TaxID=3154951 RepID=UPI003442EAC7
MIDAPASGETMEEIAARHGRSYNTVRNKWSRRPDWPAPKGKRGHHNVYDPKEVDDWVRDHLSRSTPGLQPNRLYTGAEIATAAGISPATIRADRNRGRWPEPDDTHGGVNRWYGRTATAALAKRRGYRRSTTA